MRKLLLALAVIASVAAPASARSQRSQVDTQEFAVDACTSSTVNVSATAGSPTNVLNAGVSMSSATYVEIYNADSTYMLNCGYETNVSSAASSAAYGREIPTKIGRWLQANLDKFSGIHCYTQNSAAVTRATITLCR